MLNEQIKQIAERLRELRDVLDLTVEDIAQKTGISPENVTKFESGESDIPMSFICDVAQACGVQPVLRVEKDREGKQDLIARLAERIFNGEKITYDTELL